MSRARWSLVVLFLLAAHLRADEWPVPRGASREPLPYRYHAAVLKTIPKDVLDDSSACVLYTGTTHLLEVDGTSEAITHELTRLNSRKGIDKLGEYRAIYYDPTYEKLTLNEARVIKANGKIVLVEPRHVQLRDVATDFQVYDQSKQLVISFPNLEVGDIYEVKWTIRGKSKEFGGHFFSRYNFGDDNLPVLRDEFRVRVPKNKTLHHQTVNGNVNLVVNETEAEKFYHWTANDCRELPKDEERPSKEELRLQVVVSTFPSWDAVGQWKHNLRKDCWTCTPEIRKIVADVTRGKETQGEKAKALTYWVRRNIRYHSQGPGGLGYTPHTPQAVLDSLYGDCKDQAQLLAVMLREIGLPVWLVTLGTLDDGQVLKEVPSPWGSHAILLTKIDGKEHWIDTTISFAPWNFLPRSDRDRQVYMTKDAELTLLRTPPFTARDYRIEQTTHVSVQPDGTSRCKREGTFHGNAAWIKRDRWLEVPPGERRRNVIAEIQDAHPKARIHDLKIDEASLRDFDKPVKAEVEFEVAKHFTGDSTREGSVSDSPVWTWFLGYSLDVERQLPFVLPTPFESAHKYVIQIPPIFRFDGIPESKSVASKWGKFNLKVTQDAKSPHRLELAMHMQLEIIRVEKNDFAAFQQFQDDVAKAYRVWLYLKPAAAIADAPHLEKHLAECKYADADAVKALAKLYLDNNRVADARAVLDKAAKLFPRDPKLWDLRVSTAPNIDEEERLYRAMAREFPDSPLYAVALGAVAVRREDHKNAEKILTPLTTHALLPIRGAAHYQLARSAFRQNDAAKALKHLNAALIADSSSLATMDALHFKARVHEKLGQLKETIQTLTSALEAEPNARDILEFLVRIEFKAGQKEAALDHLRRYTVAAAKDLSSVVKAADLHLELGRLDDAFELASRARDVGFQAKAQRVLGLVHHARHDYTQAAFHLERCDLDGKALAALMQSQIRIGELDAAQRSVENVRRLEKPDASLLEFEKNLDALVARRNLLIDQWEPPIEQKASAIRVVNRCLCAERGLQENWPREQVEKLINEAAKEELEYAPLLAIRAFVLLEKGQLRKAIADADAAIKLQPNEARAFTARGRARLEQGNINGALSDLRKATEFSKREDPMILHWFAAALLDAGRTQEAIDTQRLALLLRPNDAELMAQLRRMEAKKTD